MTKLFGLFLLIFLANPAYSIELRSAQFELGKLYNKRDPAAQQWTLLQEAPKGEGKEAWNHQVGLLLDTDLLKFENSTFYWDQKVEAQSTTVQYRRVHWEFEFGFDFSNKVQTFWYHRSEHLLDYEQKDYPLHDVYGVRLCLIGSCKR